MSVPPSRIVVESFLPEFLAHSNEGRLDAWFVVRLHDDHFRENFSTIGMPEESLVWETTLRPDCPRSPGEPWPEGSEVFFVGPKPLYPTDWGAMDYDPEDKGAGTCGCKFSLSLAIRGPAELARRWAGTADRLAAALATVGAFDGRPVFRRPPDSVLGWAQRTAGFLRIDARIGFDEDGKRFRLAEPHRRQYLGIPQEIVVAGRGPWNLTVKSAAREVYTEGREEGCGGWFGNIDDEGGVECDTDEQLAQVVSCCGLNSPDEPIRVVWFPMPNIAHETVKLLECRLFRVARSESVPTSPAVAPLSGVSSGMAGGSSTQSKESTAVRMPVKRGRKPDPDVAERDEQTRQWAIDNPDKSWPEILAWMNETFPGQGLADGNALQRQIRKYCKRTDKKYPTRW